MIDQTLLEKYQQVLEQGLIYELVVKVENKQLASLGKKGTDSLHTIKQFSSGEFGEDILEKIKKVALNSKYKGELVDTGIGYGNNYLAFNYPDANSLYYASRDVAQFFLNNNFKLIAGNFTPTKGEASFKDNNDRKAVVKYGSWNPE